MDFELFITIALAITVGPFVVLACVMATILLIPIAVCLAVCLAPLIVLCMLDATMVADIGLVLLIAIGTTATVRLLSAILQLGSIATNDRDNRTPPSSDFWFHLGRKCRFTMVDRFLDIDAGSHLIMVLASIAAFAGAATVILTM